VGWGDRASVASPRFGVRATSFPTRVQPQPSRPIVFPAFVGGTAAVFAALSVPFVAAVLGTEIHESLLSVLAAVGLAVVVLAAAAFLRRSVHARRWAARQASVAAVEAIGGTAAMATLVVDGSGTIVSLSPLAEAALGYESHQLAGTRLESLLARDDVPAVADLLAQTPDRPDARRIEARLRHRDGRWLTFETVVTSIVAVGGQLAAVLVIHDVTKWKALEEQLTRQAFHDALTGLPNRALYIDRLDHALGRRRHPAKAVAVMFLDLDDFKTVNDSLGHVEGDALIQLVAERLSRTIRPEDTAARLGGDEFALLIDEVDEDEAVGVASRVLAAFEPPFELADRPLRVAASIGIALSSSALPTATDILRAADIAMYHAKDAGKGQYRVFEPSMQQVAADRLRLGIDLRGAVERGEFVLHYQPVVSLSTGATVGMEALVRWQHPERGLIAPKAFIPLAESSGLIIPLGEWVLREACRQAKTWVVARRDQPPLGISVNLSGVQLQHSGLVATVSLALEDADLSPDLLTLEITESVMARETDATLRRLRQLKGLGVHLAIDDFGTGYSSLSYLRRFPIDTVKIDKTFIDGIEAGGRDAALARAILRLAKSMKMTTVAEGVESESQVRKLTAMGCDLAQGFHLARPLEIQQATAHVLGRTTISLWVGHAGKELDVIRAVVAEFERSNPTLLVDVLGGVHDDRTIAAMRSGQPPDVATLFESDKFGECAADGLLVDLAPWLRGSGIDESILTPATEAYTRYQGRRFALPMLADAYGLYYNEAMFAKAQLPGPPRTPQELADYAKRLTTWNPDGSLAVVGFNPLLGFYENDLGPFGHLFGADWLDRAGRPAVASDPRWARMLRWLRELVDWYGYEELVRFGESAGGEFSPSNAFGAGRLAMMLDGEWRVAFLAADAPELPYRTAPLPVDPDAPDRYGSGYINGTILGIPANAEHKPEAWSLVCYLATDERALATLSNGLRNVPSTVAALHSPDLVPDERFATFLEIFAHPRSGTTPISASGADFQDVFATFVEEWQAGRIRDLGAGLARLAADIETRRRRAQIMPPARLERQRAV
jgi:diguanylate cyclase (GGDEF)-like protein/PAS domain S-box-containing protein